MSNMWSCDTSVTCNNCGKKYESSSDYLKDCFIDSDGWSWDYFHNCLKDKGLEIHGYETE